MFDADPSGKAMPGLRLICRGILTITNSELYTNAAVDDGGAIFAEAAREFIEPLAMLIPPREIIGGAQARVHGRTLW